MNSFNGEYLRQHSLAVAALVFVLSVLTYVIGLTDTFELYDDSALYIVFGRSLIEGNGLLNTIGPVAVPGHYYPFFYPLLLGLVMKFVSASVVALKSISVVAGSLALAAAFLSLIREYDAKKAALALLLAILSPQIVLYSRLILSEMVFMFFSLAACLFLGKYAKEKTLFNRWLTAAAVALFCSVYTRLVGISLLVAAVVYLVYSRQFRKAALFGLVSALIIVPWLWQNLSSASSAYFGEFAYWNKGWWGFVLRWGYNLAATVGKELPDLFFYPFFAGIDPRASLFILKGALGVILALSVFVGFLSRLRRSGPGMIEIYVLVYVFVFYLSWTHHGARYLLPLLPFLLYYLVSGVQVMVTNRKAAGAVFLAICLLAVSGTCLITAQAKFVPYNRTQRSFIEAADWISNNSHADSIILSRHPAWLYYYTGKKGVKFLLNDDPAVQMDTVSKNGVDLVVIDQDEFYRKTAGDYLFPMVKNWPQRFLKVYETVQVPGTVIYRVVRK